MVSKFRVAAVAGVVFGFGGVLVVVDMLDVGVEMDMDVVALDVFGFNVLFAVVVVVVDVAVVNVARFVVVDFLVVNDLMGAFVVIIGVDVLGIVDLRGGIIVEVLLIRLIVEIVLVAMVVWTVVLVVVGNDTHSGTGKSHVPLSMHDKKPSPLITVSFSHCTSTNVPSG